MTEIVIRVVDCWVIRKEKDHVKYLIMKRAGKLLYEGIYHCVHGKIKDGEKAWETAIRELHEETGMTPIQLWTADTTSSFYEASDDRFNLVPVFVALVEEQDVKLSKEHDTFEWLTFQEASNRVTWNNHKSAIEGIHRMFSTEFPHKKWLEVKI